MNHSLVAVISLPRGCFNPYSPVKTSVLILDKSLAKQADSVAFFKIENDGYGLGAQRRAVANSDLPQVKKELDEYLSALRQRRSVSELSPTCGLIVTKEKIAANGEFNLSGERYREGAAASHTFPLVRIADVCTVNPRKSQLAERDPDTRVSFVPMADLNEHQIAFEPKDDKLLLDVSASHTYFEDNDVLVAKVTPCFENGKAGIARNLLSGIGFGSSEFYVLRSNGQVLPEWIYFCVMHPLFRDAAVAQMTGTGGLQRVPRDYVENFQIPLPPLEVQKEIVAEIEGYQKVIDGARAVLDHYRSHIPINPDWPMIALGDACAIRSGGTPSRSNPDYWNGSIPWVTTTLINYGSIRTANEFITEDGLSNSSTWIVPKGTVLMAMYGEGVTRGRVAILDIDAAINQACAAFVLKIDSLLPAYLYLVLQSRYEDLRSISEARGGNQSNLSAQVLKAYEIPLPPLATQQTIVAEIDAEQALVNGNRELITRFEQKIQTTLARVWGVSINSGSAPPDTVVA